MAPTALLAVHRRTCRLGPDRLPPAAATFVHVGVPEDPLIGPTLQPGDDPRLIPHDGHVWMQPNGDRRCGLEDLVGERPSLDHPEVFVATHRLTTRRNELVIVGVKVTGEGDVALDERLEARSLEAAHGVCVDRNERSELASAAGHVLDLTSAGGPATSRATASRHRRSGLNFLAIGVAKRMRQADNLKVASSERNEMSAPARLVCVPSADTTFALAAQAIADAIPAGVDAADALRWFTAGLTRVYPTAVVHEQDELARIDDAPPVWYVTRRERLFRIDASVSVPLVPEDAYRLYVERMSEWQSAVALTPKRVTEEVIGTEYLACYTFLGRDYTGILRIIAADPGRSISVEAEGSGITVWYVTRFREDGTGTAVTVRGDYDLPRNVIARIADHLGLERSIRRDIHRANESYRVACVAMAEALATGRVPVRFTNDDLLRSHRDG
jgi:hypothetical protein